MSIEFEWDEKKADANFRKHKVLFVAAAQVFDDPYAVAIQDRVEANEVW